MGYEGWENYGQSPAVAAKEKDLKKQYQGKLNHDNGEAFEEYINTACFVCRVQKVAYVEKTPEPFKVTEKTFDKGLPMFKGYFTQPAQPDFKGTLSGGQAICFEAKTSSTDNIKQSRVTEKQSEALEFHRLMGAKCFVYVAIQMKHFFRVPWYIWTSMKEKFGRKYMTLEDLEPYRLKEKQGVILIFDDLQ